MSAAESVKFTRGLVKDDIREAIARGEKPDTALGVAAGDSAGKTGSLEEEVREELEIERVVIHAKALERRAKESQKAKVELEEFKKEELRIQLRKEAEYNEQVASQLEGEAQKYAIEKAKVLREMDIRLGQAKIIGQEKLVSMMLSLGSKEANIGAVDAYGRMIDYISFKSGEITDKKMPWLKSEVGAITRVAASNVADFAKEHFPGAAGALANAATKVHEAKTLAYDAGKLSFGERIVADLIIDAAMIEVGAGAVKFTGQVGASGIEGVRASRPAKIADISHSQRKGFYSSHAVKTDLEQTYRGKVSSTTVPDLSQKNVKLAGTRHPETGVVFDQKGFPVFDKSVVYELKLPEQIAKIENEGIHMRTATRILREDIVRGKVNRSIFTDRQLRQIMSGKSTVENLSWHHHQDFGRMQFMSRQQHKTTGHVGGMDLWFKK